MKLNFQSADIVHPHTALDTKHPKDTRTYILPHKLDIHNHSQTTQGASSNESIRFLPTNQLTSVYKTNYTLNTSNQLCNTLDGSRSQS